MARFKKGDRVRIINDVFQGFDTPKGTMGIVKVDDGSHTPKIEFDNDHTLWTKEADLELTHEGRDYYTPVPDELVVKEEEEEEGSI